MDVLGLVVSLYEPLVPRHVGQNPKLDLGIIRIHEHKALLRHEDLPDLPTQGHADRNVLKIRFRTADPPRRRDGLVELPVDPPVGGDKGRKPVRIGGL